MFRIDVPTANAILSAPAAVGTPGYFNNGNPALLIPSTVVDMDWLNSVQEELVAIATALGGALSKTTRNQCLTAIQAMIQQQTGNYAVDTGAADVYVGAYTPAITAYVDGMILRLFVANTNLTTTPTFNAGTPGAKAILRDDGTAIVAGDLPANSYAAFEYRAATTKWYLLSVTQNVAAAAIQAQSPNYQPAGGTANAITATYAPGIGAHITGAPLRVKIATTNTGAVTFNPGPGVKNVVTPQGAALSQGDLVAGALVTFMYDGVSYQFMEATNALLATAVSIGLAMNLVIQQNAGTPTTQVDVSWDRLVVFDTNNHPLTIAAGTATINAALNGAINRLDTGALAANTCYDVFFIAKADGTGQGCILTLAANTATNFIGATTQTTINALGYTGGYYMRLGTVITGAGSTFRRTIQTGNKVTNIVAGVSTGYPVIIAFAGANGSTAVPTFVSTNIRADSGIAGAMVPAKAKRHKILASIANIAAAANFIAAPSANYGAFGSFTNPSPIAYSTNNTSQTNTNWADEWAFEGNNAVFYANNGAMAGNGGLFSMGWTESVNAA